MTTEENAEARMWLNRDLAVVDKEIPYDLKRMREGRVAAAGLEIAKLHSITWDFIDPRGKLSRINMTQPTYPDRVTNESAAIWVDEGGENASTIEIKPRDILRENESVLGYDVTGRYPRPEDGTTMLHSFIDEWLLAADNQQQGCARAVVYTTGYTPRRDRYVIQDAVIL